MNKEIENIYSKLVNLETEVNNLRQGYAVINQRYSEAIGTLKNLTSSALEAAKRAAIAAEKALLAARNSAKAAQLAAAVRMSNAAAESARSARKKAG